MKRSVRTQFSFTIRTCPHELLDSILLNIQKNGRILEMGSGKGELAIQIKKMGFEIVATDLSHQALSFARKNYPELPVIECDAHILPFRNETFDSAISIELIEHLHTMDKHLKEVRRVIKSSGWYFLKTPNKLFHDAFHRITARARIAEKKHPSAMSLPNLQQKLKGHEFEITFIKLKRIQGYQIEKVVNRMKSQGIEGLIEKSLETIPLRLLPAIFQPSLIFIAKKRCDADSPLTTSVSVDRFMYQRENT